MIRPAVVLVNLVTLGSLASGIFAITQGLAGHYGLLYAALTGCLVLDGIDGVLARRLGAETQFGKYADAVSDFVAFGLGGGLAIAAGMPFESALPLLLLWPFAAAARLVGFVWSPQVPGQFAGLPLPAATFAMIGMAHILPSSTSISTPWLYIVAATAAGLMASERKFPKRTSAMLACFAAAAGLHMLDLTPLPDAMVVSTACLVFIGLPVFDWLGRSLGLGLLWRQR